MIRLCLRVKAALHFSWSNLQDSKKRAASAGLMAFCVAASTGLAVGTGRGPDADSAKYETCQAVLHTNNDHIAINMPSDYCQFYYDLGTRVRTARGRWNCKWSHFRLHFHRRCSARPGPMKSPKEERRRLRQFRSCVSISLHPLSRVMQDIRPTPRKHTNYVTRAWSNEHIL